MTSRILFPRYSQPRQGRFFYKPIHLLALFILLLIARPDINAATTETATAPALDAIWVIDIRGAIGPAVADHFRRGLEQAQNNNARLLILRMDTPGGLDKAMRDIIKGILASPIPVVSYVAPSGARAASAGTYIMYASHIATMAPATNIGAATPVAIGAPAGGPNQEKSDSEGGAKQDSMKQKMVNDAIAYIEGLAELRGRNKEWAVAAVQSAQSVSAQEALKKNIINLVATDLTDLLTQLNNYSVTVQGKETVLHTEAVAVVYYQANWRSKFLATITDPSIAYILLLIGFYGLVLEFYSPGMIGPGVVGSISLLIALYALQLLPVNYAGVALILLGLGLMVAEAMVPSFGLMGFGGIVAFIIGSIILIDTEEPAFQIAKPIIFAFSTLSIIFMTIILSLLMRIRKKDSTTGMETFLGKTARVESIYKEQPKIRIDGELWYVNSEEPLAINDLVEVTEAKDMVLKVRKLVPIQKRQFLDGN